MSTLRGLRFCDKCDKSIAKDEVHYKYNDEHYCAKCKKKHLKVKKSFPFKKTVAVCALALGLTLGYTRDEYTQNRIDETQAVVIEVAMSVVDLEYKIRKSFNMVNGWATSVEKRLMGVDAKYAKQTEAIQRLLDETKKEVQQVLQAQKNLVKDLETGRMTDKQSAAVIIQLENRARAIEAKLQHLMHSPDALVEKVLKPVVGIGVSATDKLGMRGSRIRGSGVLFKRVAMRDAKGRTFYRYYGMTAYHVWDSVFKYQEAAKKGLLKDAQGNKREDVAKPKLAIYVYNGNTAAESMIIHTAKWVHPTKSIPGKYLPMQDFATFTFDNYQKLNVAELATDQELKKFKKYGSPVMTAGIAPAQSPGVWMGYVANPNVGRNGGTMCHAYGYYGQSGGPTFDAKTLKVVGINQRINVHPILGGMDAAPDTNVLYITTVDIYRLIFRVEVKPPHKKLLD